MKLRNTRNQMVRIRLPKHRLNFEMKPLEAIEVDMRTRQAILPFMQVFGLTLEADDADFHPNAILPEKKVSNTEDNNELQKKPYIEGENDAEPTDEEMENLLYAKGTEETGQTETESNGDTSEPTSGDGDSDGDGFELEPIGPIDEDQEEGDGETAIIEPVGLEGTEEDLLTEEERIEEELTGVPEACPYALTELRIKTKAELWEICENLGLEDSGTKAALVERIVNSYRNM